MTDPYISDLILELVNKRFHSDTSKCIEIVHNNKLVNLHIEILDQYPL